MTALPDASGLANRPRGVGALLAEGVSAREVMHALRRSWRPALLFLGLLPALVVAVGLMLPRRYASGAMFMVDLGPNLRESSGVIGLASQLGIGGLGGAPSPQLYADLLHSRTLLERTVTVLLPLGAAAPISLEAHWAGDRPLDPRTREAAIRRLARHLTPSANPRTNIVGFTLQAPSPLAAKLIADSMLAGLNDLLIGIRRQRATAERAFVEERYAELGDTLHRYEDELRQFYESNRALDSPRLRFEEKRLTDRLGRVEAAYRRIGAEVEDSRLQEARDTPALSVIDPPEAPTRKAFPRLRAWAVLALAIGSCLLLGWALLDAVRVRVGAASASSLPG